MTFLDNSRRSPHKKKSRKKRLLSRKCPLCGKRLAVRFNDSNGEKFLGCSNYPRCKHTEPVAKVTEVDQLCKFSLVTDWRPDIHSDVIPILSSCQSTFEKSYLLGVAYFLDKESNSRTWLYRSSVVYQHKHYVGIAFDRPWDAWEKIGIGGPSALMFVPQLSFGEKLHHDFGVFYGWDTSPREDEWVFHLAVEIDIHSSHRTSSIDWFRDSLVSYLVLRVVLEDDPLNWFSKIIDIDYKRWLRLQPASDH